MKSKQKFNTQRCDRFFIRHFPLPTNYHLLKLCVCFLQMQHQMILYTSHRLVVKIGKKQKFTTKEITHRKRDGDKTSHKDLSLV